MTDSLYDNKTLITITINILVIPVKIFVMSQSSILNVHKISVTFPILKPSIECTPKSVFKCSWTPDPIHCRSPGGALSQLSALCYIKHYPEAPKRTTASRRWSAGGLLMTRRWHGTMVKPLISLGAIVVGSMCTMNEYIPRSLGYCIYWSFKKSRKTK